MLDCFVVFTRAGVVLWSLALADASSAASSAAQSRALDTLCRDVLVNDRAALDTLRVGERLQLKWALANSLGLVFVAIYDQANAARVPYADALLKAAADSFVRLFGERIVARGRAFAEGGAGINGSDDAVVTGGRLSQVQQHAAALAGASALAVAGRGQAFAAFDPVFNRLLDEVESSSAGGRPVAAASSQGGAVSLKGGASMSSASSSSSAATPPSLARGADTPADGVDEDDLDAEAEREMAALGLSPGMRPPMMAAPRPKGGAASGPGSASSKGKGGKGGTPAGPSGSQARKGGAAAGSADKSKEGRSWGDSFVFDEKKAAALDKSAVGAGGAPSAGGDAALLNVTKVAFSGTGAGGSGADLSTGDAEDGDAEVGKAGVASSLAASASSWFARSALGSWVSSLTGNKVLGRADLEPVAESLRTHLMGKNVAKEVADDLCDSLVGQLSGTRLESGLAALTVQSKVSAAVRAALRESIERILTPRRAVDLLREVRAKRAAGAGAGPYVVVFCGVNGVGKSTSLAKTTFHLKDHGHSVLIAACDSFRSGAVEQLKRHCAALDVPLYQQGYSKDPVQIAADAIRRARDEGLDVVLIDTAGRMQNNAALMQQLARLVAVNKPDLVLFVGEALVGNDGVDQLVEFDRRLVDQAVDAAAPRRIDGIILTKFDTVDDKVGAALSMVYRTQIPVVFLGTGQSYPDLRRMNVDAVIKSLLAP